jgi:prenyltransferase beta subunit
MPPSAVTFTFAALAPCSGVDISDEEYQAILREFEHRTLDLLSMNLSAHLRNTISKKNLQQWLDEPDSPFEIEWRFHFRGTDLRQVLGRLRRNTSVSP